MNLFLGLSYGRENETGVCGIALTQDDGKSLVEQFRGEPLSFAEHSATGDLICGSNGMIVLNDRHGDIVGSVVMFQVDEANKSILIQDSDSHWYVIPVSRQSDFQRWERAMWNCDDWKEDWEPQRVNGPQSIHFTDWKEV